MPFWIGIGAVWATSRFLKNESFLAIAQAALAPLVIPVVFTIDHLTHSSADSRLLIVCTTFALTAFLADQIANHFHRWLTAHAGMDDDERERMRAAWSKRFLSPYSFNFILAGFPFILVAKNTLTPEALALVMPTLAAAWVFRPRTICLDWGLKSTFRAVASFLSWGCWEEPLGAPTPGVFRSPAGPCLLRWILTASTITALSIVFSPSLASVFDNASAGSAAIAVVRAVVIPSVLTLSVVAIVAGRERGVIGEHLDWLYGDEDGTSCFRHAVRKVREATGGTHVLLGWHYHYFYPVLLSIRLLWEHVHIMGATGSGKSTRGLQPLLEQLIELGEYASFIIDLKGTMSLFQRAFENSLDRDFDG